MVSLLLAARAERVIWVDPRDGSDANDGTRAAPLRTLYAARDAAEQTNSAVIELAAGVHHLDPARGPLELDTGRGGALALRGAPWPLASWISGGVPVPADCWEAAEPALGDGSPVLACRPDRVSPDLDAAAPDVNLAGVARHEATRRALSSVLRAQFRRH